MPKIYVAKLVVPSGSRTTKLYQWLNKLLESHGMSIQVLQLEDGSEGISEPGVPLLEVVGVPRAPITFDSGMGKTVEPTAEQIHFKNVIASGQRTLCGLTRMPKGHSWVGVDHRADIREEDRPKICEECREFVT